MPLRSKIVLKSDLSQETDGRHTLEHFDGGFSIYLHDRADARLVQEQFPSLIAAVQNVR